MSKELIVGPFPKCLNKEEREEFLLYFGALNVIHITKKKKELYSIAQFKSNIDCQYALKKLHQIDLFGTRISAKFYNSSHHEKQQIDSANFINNLSEDKCSKSDLKNALLEYEAHLSAISSNFDIQHPLPPKLRYAYPPPTPLVLSNIAHSLVAVPKFYTQVLHLMNKMNLPCPFGPLTEEPPICREAKSLTKAFSTRDELANKNLETNVDHPIETEVAPAPLFETESESEIESDEEIKSMFVQEKNKSKRTLRIRPKNVIKRPKLETLKQSLLTSKVNVNLVPKDDSLALQEVFEMSNLNPKRTLNVNVQSTCLTSDATPKEDVGTEGFGKIYPQSREKDDCKETQESSHYISLEELSNNRIPKTDWPIVPVFKNYQCGNPSTRLYIKNLAKTVTEYDLRFIFGRFVPPNSDESQLNIRLMKEGRMKGQAFVSFAVEETATKALEEVNGYILKDKPMVIVFGKVKPND